jgi:hypothetical protein
VVLFKVGTSSYKLVYTRSSSLGVLSGFVFNTVHRGTLPRA